MGGDGSRNHGGTVYAGRERDGSAEGVYEDEDEDGASYAEALPRLMAHLGRLLEEWGPGGIVMVSREEYDRREMAAYAAGWQDAAAEYQARIASARWEGLLGRRPPRVVHGPGEVIAFPLGRRAATADEEVPAGHGDAEADEGLTDGSADGRARPQASALPAEAKTTLVPKNRRSRAPTIPRLEHRTRQPRGLGDTPD